MTLDSVLTGIVTGVVASIIIIVMQTIFDYIKRKKYEMFHFYEFDSFDIDECAPPEYLRESGNVNITVQMYPCSEGTDTGNPVL